MILIVLFKNRAMSSTAGKVKSPSTVRIRYSHCKSTYAYIFMKNTEGKQSLGCWTRLAFLHLGLLQSFLIGKKIMAWSNDEGREV